MHALPCRHIIAITLCLFLTACGGGRHYTFDGVTSNIYGDEHPSSNNVKADGRGSPGGPQAKGYSGRTLWLRVMGRESQVVLLVPEQAAPGELRLVAPDDVHAWLWRVPVDQRWSDDEIAQAQDDFISRPIEELDRDPAAFRLKGSVSIVTAREITVDLETIDPVTLHEQYLYNKSTLTNMDPRQPLTGNGLGYEAKTPWLEARQARTATQPARIKGTFIGREREPEYWRLAPWYWFWI